MTELQRNDIVEQGRTLSQLGTAFYITFGIVAMLFLAIGVIIYQKSEMSKEFWIKYSAAGIIALLICVIYFLFGIGS